MELKNFTDLNEVEKILVFGWRNHLKIAPLMKTQTIPLKEHLRFLESLKCDSTKQYFLALRGDEILGVLCFTGIERGISCEFGIYQNPDLKGNGKALMEAMLRYAKENLKVLTINACAINENTKAITLYQNFGFQLTHKDTQMSYFYLNVAGGGAKLVAFRVTFRATLFPLITQATIPQDSTLLAYKIRKTLKNTESQTLLKARIPQPSPFLSLCA